MWRSLPTGGVAHIVQPSSRSGGVPAHGQRWRPDPPVIDEGSRPRRRVTAVTGSLVRVRWPSEEETTVVPAPGTRTVLATSGASRDTAPTKKAAQEVSHCDHVHIWQQAAARQHPVANEGCPTTIALIKALGAVRLAPGRTCGPGRCRACAAPSQRSPSADPHTGRPTHVDSRTGEDTGEACVREPTAAVCAAPDGESARRPRVLHARGTSNACDGADG